MRASNNPEKTAGAARPTPHFLKQWRGLETMTGAARHQRPSPDQNRASAEVARCANGSLLKISHTAYTIINGPRVRPLHNKNRKLSQTYGVTAGHG